METLCVCFQLIYYLHWRYATHIHSPLSKLHGCNIRGIFVGIVFSRILSVTSRASSCCRHERLARLTTTTTTTFLSHHESIQQHQQYHVGNRQQHPPLPSPTLINNS
jgi:hypothetical protein